MDRSRKDQPEFDLKKARFEVQKYGIKGFQGNQKDEAMTSFLIKLGAKVMLFHIPGSIVMDNILHTV